jgi:hypothetical protein
MSTLTCNPSLQAHGEKFQCEQQKKQNKNRRWLDCKVDENCTKKYGKRWKRSKRKPGILWSEDDQKMYDEA